MAMFLHLTVAVKVLRLSALLLILAACSAGTRYKVLSVVFDGVPEPEPEAPAEALLEVAETQPVPIPLEPAEPELTASELAAGGFAAIDQLPLRSVPRMTGEGWQSSDLPLETAATWEEALKLLPLDVAGGVDWVAAVEQGLSVPQLVLDVDAAAPFTLDNLVAGGALKPDSPFFDFTVQMTPEDNEFFEVEFPHSSHTLFLACSSCHPGVRDWKVPMEKILGGQACGQCHGRVSFAPETSCARCHGNLTPPEEPAVHAEVERARTEPIAANPELLERGETLYGQYCGFCHGETGDGKGRLARWLTTKPRDFTDGTYKFRSTAGPLPRDEDLFKTITRGIPGTSMPAWSVLAYEDRWALVHYIKSLSDWFSEEEPEAPLLIAESPAVTDQLLAMGEELYTGAGCSACHGKEGGGDGPSADSLKDKWGQPVRPYSFASGRPMKSGTGPEDVFRIVTAGIGGTPMPAFGESLTPQQVWSVAHFVTSLNGRQRAPFAVRGDIVFQRGGNAGGGGQEPSGDDDGGFWGEEETSGDDDGGGFWGDEEASGDDDGGFWGDDEVAEKGTDGDGGFWGDDEVAAEDNGIGEDFWGDEVAEEDAGGDDFWGEEVAEDAGGDDFWGDETDDAEAQAADSFVEHALDFPEGQPEVPPATFPHWLHRIRLKCANCHPKVFEMKAGANPINMDAMRAGLYCAKCHNGKVTWQIGFTNCPQCHQARPTP